jgi:hypothetical protein
MHPLHLAPVHASAPAGGSWFFTVLCAAIFGAATVWALRRAALGDATGLLTLAGGLVASLIEAMLDNLGLLWFYTDNKAIVFHVFGRSMPLFVVLGYGFYFGAITYYAMLALQRGKGARHLWGIYWFAAAFDLAVESTGNAVGLYHYFGPQPYNIWGIPLWWMFCNPVLPIVAGALFFVMRERLRDLRALLIVVLLPVCYGAIYGAIGWPIFIALNSNVPGAVIWIAGAATPLIALGVVRLTIEGVEWYRRASGIEPERAPAAAPQRRDGGRILAETVMSPTSPLMPS